MAREQVLVDGDWLEERLDDPAVVVFEVDENSQAHADRHIPGALALDWRTDRYLTGQSATGRESIVTEGLNLWDCWSG